MSTATAPPAGVRPAPAGSLPPGPRAPGPVQSTRYALDPYGFFQSGHRRFGDAFTVRVVGRTWVVLGHPDDAREVFAHGPEDLNSGEANLPLRPVLGTRNVLLLDGPEHLRRRKLVLPPFHGQRMKTYTGIVTAAAGRDLASWPLGRPLPVLPHMQAITFEVILRAVFGVEEAARLERLAAVLRSLLSWITDPRRAAVFGYLGPERVMAMSGYRRQLAAVDAEVLGEVARRREAADLQERTDVLSLLLAARDGGQGLSDRELRDELVTLLVAGHETTAALLAWALQELAAHPRLQERLAEGQEGLADAVVQETLRLHPPVPLVLRRLRRPMRLAGRDLPEGATVAPCALIVHRRPDLWERPREFRPERFMDGRAPAGTLFPFGGGVRRCIGASFATFEARIVLEEVVSRFRLEPAGRVLRGVGRRGIVLVPRRGGPVVARPRG